MWILNIYQFLVAATEMIAVWVYYDQTLESKRPQWAGWLSFFAVY